MDSDRPSPGYLSLGADEISRRALQAGFCLVPTGAGSAAAVPGRQAA
ncbi:hypothetical protein I552_1300 [Mycobacterium xenopi 3993]|nr:hypothetical protein I552_1300 [Mycobacterium xenopi 3993]